MAYCNNEMFHLLMMKQLANPKVSLWDLCDPIKAQQQLPAFGRSISRDEAFDVLLNGVGGGRHAKGHESTQVCREAQEEGEPLCSVSIEHTAEFRVR